MTRCIRIATRSSPLAMWQARFVARSLKEYHPSYSFKIIPFTASADKDLKTPLYSMGTVGVFAKEVHQAVLNQQADIGVHSCKDLPTQSPEGIHIQAICRRHDPRDCIIGHKSFNSVKQGAHVGTSSLRRRLQLHDIRPDLKFSNIRGNVGTRLSKIDNGDYDATLMASAGLKRLDIQYDVVHFSLNPYTECCPAPAQGAIAVDCLESRIDLSYLLQTINHLDTQIAINIEREVLAGLQGGCSLPLGCYVTRNEQYWKLQAVLGHEDKPLQKVSISGCASNLAQRALEQLLG